ncbi:MAG: HEPN domain-containing protein [Thermodesulfobacteriota bacterium]
MPRRPGFTGKPEDWLRRAKGNLARAKQTKPKDAFWEDLCFDAQQAAEKAIKAVLIFRKLEFRKTHDLRELLTLLNSGDFPIPEEIWEAVDLSDYAVETRYPGVTEPVSEKEYRVAVALAKTVVGWAGKQITQQQRRKTKS